MTPISERARDLIAHSICAEKNRAEEVEKFIQRLGLSDFGGIDVLRDWEAVLWEAGRKGKTSSLKAVDLDQHLGTGLWFGAWDLWNDIQDWADPEFPQLLDTEVGKLLAIGNQIDLYLYLSEDGALYERWRKRGAVPVKRADSPFVFLERLAVQYAAGQSVVDIDFQGTLAERLGEKLELERIPEACDSVASAYLGDGIAVIEEGGVTTLRARSFELAVRALEAMHEAAAETPTSFTPFPIVLGSFALEEKTRTKHSGVPKLPEPSGDAIALPYGGPDGSGGWVIVADRKQPRLEQYVAMGERVLERRVATPKSAVREKYPLPPPSFEELTPRGSKLLKKVKAYRDPRHICSEERARALLEKNELPVFDKVLALEAKLGGLTYSVGSGEEDEEQGPELELGLSWQLSASGGFTLPEEEYFEDADGPLVPFGNRCIEENPETLWLDEKARVYTMNEVEDLFLLADDIWKYLERTLADDTGLGSVAPGMRAKAFIDAPFDAPVLTVEPGEVLGDLSDTVCTWWKSANLLVRTWHDKNSQWTEVNAKSANLLAEALKRARQKRRKVGIHCSDKIKKMLRG